MTTSSIHARIPQETIEKLDQVASNVGRSRNWVFNEALTQYVQTQQWYTDLINQRLAEAQDGKTSFFPHEEMMLRQQKRLKKKLGL